MSSALGPANCGGTVKAIEVDSPKEVYADGKKAMDGMSFSAEGVFSPHSSSSVRRHR